MSRAVAGGVPVGPKGDPGTPGLPGGTGPQGPPGPGTGAGAWQPSTAYTATQVVQAPDGSMIQRNSTGTSRSSFDSTEKAAWTAIEAVPGTMSQQAVAAAGGSSVARTPVKTANYTASARDLVPVDTTGGAVTITLPNAPADKSQVAVKHIIQGGTNAVTVACAGSDVFNKTGGATTHTLALLAEGAIYQYDAANHIWTILSDDIALSQLDLRYVQPSQVAPLAQAGQTPSQAPLPTAQTASPGSQAVAARADHVHTLGVSGRNIAFPHPWDPAWTYDIHLDGTATVFPLPPGAAGSNSWTPTKSGSTYTAPGNNGGLILARDFTLDAGVTLQSVQKANAGQGGIVIFATRTITINGSLIADGNNASGATGGNGRQNGQGHYVGGAGATGGTGAGAQADSMNGMGNGGQGGAGGASGATAGGAARYGGTGAGDQFGMQGILMLASNTHDGDNYMMCGGYGGGAGAGDGTNAGGGGGAGGGVVLLIAPTIIIGSTAIVSAKGGNGANGVGGNAGGGGGGGCGLIAMHAYSLSIDPAATLRNTFGAGGAGAGTGSAGTAGQQANGSGGTYLGFNLGSGVLTDPPIANGGRGYGFGFLLRQWA